MAAREMGGLSLADEAPILINAVGRGLSEQPHSRTDRKHLLLQRPRTALDGVLVHVRRLNAQPGSKLPQP
jgi:hypothetical protein